MKRILQILCYKKLPKAIYLQFSILLSLLLPMLLSVDLNAQCVTGTTRFDRSGTPISSICTTGDAHVVDGTETRPEIAAEIGSIAPLVAGDILIQTDAITVTEAGVVVESFDVVLEIVELDLGTTDASDNFLMLDGNNSLSLENVSPVDNPYVIYKYYIMESGTASCGNIGTPATLLSVNIDINDIDSNHDPTGAAMDDGVLSGTANDGIPDLGTQGADENFTDVGGILTSDGGTIDMLGMWLEITTTFTMNGAADEADYTIFQVDPSAVNQNGNDDWLDDINNRSDDVFPQENSAADISYPNFSCGTFVFGVTGPETNDKDRGNSFGMSSIVTQSCLPVELLSFSAKANKEHIDLVWKTATEIDNDYFDLERSENGKNYKSIARIEGQGTTLQEITYAYEDAEIISNTLYYYRLRQVDFDGNYEYSDVVSVVADKSKQSSVQAFPSPTEEMLVVEATNEITKIEIMDVTGAVVMQLNSDTATLIELNVSELGSGLYFVVVKTARAIDILRFVKK